MHIISIYPSIEQKGAITVLFTDDSFNQRTLTYTPSEVEVRLLTELLCKLDKK